MKEIYLKIEDDVFAEIKSGISVKGMCGALYGVVDAFYYKVVKSIDEGKTELHIEFKNKKGKKNGKTKKNS